MPYPSLEQYNQAFQLHSRLLTDPELRGGIVARTGLGLPLAISGGFALTYTITVGVKKYAVRCFHRESKALESRYAAISKRLEGLRSAYFLDFRFLPQGIRVDGTGYPIVKMAWAKGDTLGEFLEDNRSRPQALAKLSAAIAAMANFLEKERVSHGDLQTGNLMVSNGGNSVQLIDYDGMYVDAIKSLGSAELGHVNFQHPQRKLLNPFDYALDRFSLIALSLALKALQADASLWDKTNSEVDAVLFRASDYIDPESSRAFAMLAENNSLAADTRNFAAVCKAPMDKIPRLADFFAGRNIPAIAIRLTGIPSSGGSRPGYVGAYNVLSALDFEACLRRVGDKVEVIGRIVGVKIDKAKNGKEYVFVNFGDWRGKIFKVSIWSEGLAVIRSRPDETWVGKWVSVVGLMEPPYVSARYKYSHLSINVTALGQMTVLAEADAKWRLAGSNGSAPTATDSNREALGRIKVRTSPTPVVNVSVHPTASSSSSSNRAVLDKIRATSQQSAASRGQPAPRSQPTQTRPYAGGAPGSARSSQQKPAEKGAIEQFFDWLFG